MSFGLPVHVVFVLGTLLALSQSVRGQDVRPSNRHLDDYFVKEVWAKVGSVLCIQCHKKGGDAEESRLILQDPLKVQGHAQEEALRHNRDAFVRLAGKKYDGQSRILVKVSGGGDHGGGEVLKPGSKGLWHPGRVHSPGQCSAAPARSRWTTRTCRRSSTGVTMLDPERLLRRVTLSLAGRLPTDAERAAIAEKGLSGLSSLLDALMKEDAFYDRLREGFNDIFLTLGLDGNPEADGPCLRAFHEDAHVDAEARPEPHRRPEGTPAGPVQARRRLPQGAARRADETDRAHRQQ